MVADVVLAASIERAADAMREAIEIVSIVAICSRETARKDDETVAVSCIVEYRSHVKRMSAQSQDGY